MNIKEVFESAKTSNSPITSLIAKGMESKLIAIGLGKDVTLKKHKAPGPTTIVVLQGSIEYIADTRSLKLTELDEFNIPLEEIHSVRALEHAVFLLSVNK